VSEGGDGEQKTASGQDFQNKYSKFREIEMECCRTSF